MNFLQNAIVANDQRAFRANLNILNFLSHFLNYFRITVILTANLGEIETMG